MTDETKGASEPPLDCNVGRTDVARLFEAGCISRGLCPMCIASGARGDCALDMLGGCAGCGYMVPNVEHQGPPKAVPLDGPVGHVAEE